MEGGGFDIEEVPGIWPEMALAGFMKEVRFAAAGSIEDCAWMTSRR